MSADIDILAKLQRHRGYQGQRIRPHSSNPALWVAEIYTYTTPEQAHTALVVQQEAWWKELEE